MLSESSSVLGQVIAIATRAFYNYYNIKPHRNHLFVLNSEELCLCLCFLMWKLEILGADFHILLQKAICNVSFNSFLQCSQFLQEYFLSHYFWIQKSCNSNVVVMLQVSYFIQYNVKVRDLTEMLWFKPLTL